MQRRTRNPTYISNYYLKVLLDQAELKGLSKNLLIAEASLQDINDRTSVLTYDGADRVEPSKMAALIRAIWRELDDEFLGFTISPCKLGTFRLFAEQAVNCENVADVLALAARFYSTIRLDVELQLVEDANELQLSLLIENEQIDRNHFLIEFVFLCLHRFCAWLASSHLPLLRVSTNYPAPKHAAEYRFLFAASVDFEVGKNCLHFSKSTGNLPVTQKSTSLARYLAQSPTKILSRPLFSTKYSQEIAKLLLEQNELEDTTLKELATHYSFSERHLRRKLEQEGVTFQIIKNEIRKDKAIDWLADPGVSIADVGLRLGFTEPSAFTRAFKSWTGLTPRVYRSKLLT